VTGSSDAIDRYLRDLDGSLSGDRSHRRRVLEEIGNHLRDGAEIYTDQGLSSADAANRAISELGAPQQVATGFLGEPSSVHITRGAVRWLPVVLPTTLLLVYLFMTALLITWIPGGLLPGERAAMPVILRGLTFAAVMTWGGYFAVRRADADRAWRRVAWGCSALTLVFYLSSVVVRLW
jgi:hypothetical protein